MPIRPRSIVSFVFPKLYSIGLLFSIATGDATEVLGQSAARPRPVEWSDVRQSPWREPAIEVDEPTRTPDWQNLTDDSQVSASDIAQGARNPALELVQRSDAEAIRRYKKGFVQRLSFAGEWIDPSGDSGLGITNLAASSTVAIPLGSFENLLLVTPSFEVDLVDADPTVDIPNALYNTGIDFMWRKQLNDRWGTMLAVAPGYSSDFQSSADALRIRGRAFATWQWIPEHVTLLFGAVYLDRNDLPLLPGVGMIWTPTPDWRMDLIFPRPKLAYRLEFIPSHHEQWVYVSGQLGGRTWAVERTSGEADQLTLRDYRLALGWERIIDGGGGLFVEAGLSFGRELEYELSPLDQSFDDAVFVRGGIAF